MSTIPRLVISAPSSGHGKTAVAVGLLSAFVARGYRAAGFKIGPDHVDAAYLGLAAGRPGRNLDPRMVGAQRMGPLFAHGAGSLDIAVIEGTMGLFDGLAGRTDTESTAQISGLLRAPVVLVVDVGAMGQSVAALVHGFRAYDELLWLGGVILNRVASSRHELLLREALDDIGVPVLGALRRHALTEIGDSGAPLPSRHHGVAPAVHGNLDAIRAVRRLGEVISGSVDIERTMALARSSPRLVCDPWNAEAEVAEAAASNHIVASTRIGRRPVIGVAFSYPETTELLRAAGADVVPFDPLRDEVLPVNVDGLVIGSALPEAYAEELTFNTKLRAAVAAHAAFGRPIAAEGTGLVWLCRDFNGRAMCGVLDASARKSDVVVLGYREATARSSSVLLPVGAQVIGHKLHRTTVTPRAGAQPAWTWAGGPAEGFIHRAVHASYLGLHWAGSPQIASRFVAGASSLIAPAPGQWSTPNPYARPAPSPVGLPAAVPSGGAGSGVPSTLPLPAAGQSTLPLSAAGQSTVPVPAADQSAFRVPPVGQPPVSGGPTFSVPGTGQSTYAVSPAAQPAFTMPPVGRSVATPPDVEELLLAPDLTDLPDDATSNTPSQSASAPDQPDLSDEVAPAVPAPDWMDLPDGAAPSMTPESTAGSSTTPPRPTSAGGGLVTGSVSGVPGVSSAVPVSSAPAAVTGSVAVPAKVEPVNSVTSPTAPVSGAPVDAPVSAMPAPDRVPAFADLAMQAPVSAPPGSPETSMFAAPSSVDTAVPGDVDTQVFAPPGDVDAQVLAPGEVATPASGDDAGIAGPSAASGSPAGGSSEAA